MTPGGVVHFGSAKAWCGQQGVEPRTATPQAVTCLECLRAAVCNFVTAIGSPFALSLQSPVEAMEMRAATAECAAIACPPGPCPTCPIQKWKSAMIESER